MATFQNFIDSITSAASVDAGVSAANLADDPSTDANAPDLDELQAASAARTETAGDGPDVEPVYESERPLLSDAIETVHPEPHPTSKLGGMNPAQTVVGTFTLQPGDCVQVLPASGGIARNVIIFNAGSSTGQTTNEDAVFLAPDRRADTSGYALAPSFTLDCRTQSAMYAYHAAGDPDLIVSVYADTSPAP